MAWFLNRYECYRCEHEWDDEWSAGCDDECPACGARHASPTESEDLSLIIEDRDECFVVYYSPEDAEDHPSYVEVGLFLTADLAKAFAAAYAPDQIALCT